jgi:tripartite-type tricarboxylate transporter receptor subunit TctC
MGDIRSRAARLTGLQSAVAAIAIALSAQAAPAQTARTIKIVVPVPPGGAGDILARQLAEQVAQAHGITVVTENRPARGR